MSASHVLENLWFHVSKSRPVIHFWLALGGGAARWLAHIWVLRYLEEHALMPKEVSGTSMGAIIAAFIATGHTSHDIISYLHDLKFITLIDPSLQSWLIKWEKIRAYFENIFQDQKIESCNMPLRIIATDIDTGEKIIFKSWLIIDALRASVGIPGVFEPFHIAHHRLVDGGLTENIPCSALSSENIIAVSALRDVTRNTRKHTKILGFEFENHLASSYTIMQKSIDILLFQNEEKSIQSSNKHITLIRPRFPEIDYYEFSRYEEIIDIGYSEAKKILREISLGN